MSEIELSDEEGRAVASLERLAKRWPPTLTLLSYDGSLSVVRTADLDEVIAAGRQDLILADIDGIPTDGAAP